MDQRTFHIRMAPSNPLIMIASGTKSREGKNALGRTDHQQRSNGGGRGCSPSRIEPRRRRIHSSGGRGSLGWWVGSSAQQGHENEEGFGGDAPPLSFDITRATSRPTPRAKRNTQPRVTNQKRNTIGSCTINQHFHPQNTNATSHYICRMPFGYGPGGGQEGHRAANADDRGSRVCGVYMYVRVMRVA
jgi:hypothetical protein